MTVAERVGRRDRSTVRVMGRGGRASRAPRLIERRAPTPRVKVWVQFGPRTKVGEGRVRLLELVEELGSLRRAVDHLGMSYRSAWGYFRELEAIAGIAFLERPTARHLRAGIRLTAEGRRFLRRFRRFEQAVTTAAAREFTHAFREAPVVAGEETQREKAAGPGGRAATTRVPGRSRILKTTRRL